MNRVLNTNKIQLPASILSASASATGSSYSRLKDALRSKTWRSLTGWTIVAGLNDKIDFNRGGAKVATLTAGTYTSSALATHIIARLEAADATPVWACTYSGTTFKFTISSDLAFTLLWGSGANAAANCATDLGWAKSDTGSSTSQVATNASYTSKAWVKANMVSAMAATAGIVINHGSATGTYTLQGNSSDAWTSPSFTQVLAGDANIRIAFFAQQTLQWWRLLIDDCGNPRGYSEIGVWYVGTYTEAAKDFGPAWTKQLIPQNEPVYAISGAHFVDEKVDRPAWSAISWPGTSVAERDSLMAAFAVVPKGVPFFFAFDAVTTPTATEYVMLGDAASYTHLEGTYFTIDLPTLLGVLG